MRISELVTALLVKFGAVVETNVADYTGNYTLVSIYDSVKAESVVIPVGANDGSDSKYDFYMQLNPADDAMDDDLDKYNVAIKLGNRLSTWMSVSAADGTTIVDMGAILSTRMMPPKEVWVVESAVNSILPECTQIRFLDDMETQLELDCPSGTIEWSRRD